MPLTRDIGPNADLVRYGNLHFKLFVLGTYLVYAEVRATGYRAPKEDFLMAKKEGIGQAYLGVRKNRSW